MGTIEYEVENKIAIFTIRRPDKLNILTREMMKQLTDYLYQFRSDDEAWVGIITGWGDKAFCAGVDINDFLPMIRETSDRKFERPTAILRGMDLWKPLIAACNGLTIGGGLELALACDIIVASENAVFGLPEVRIGICPGGGGTVRLSRRVPWSIAAQMLFTGKPISAQEAYRVGLVNKVVPPDKLLEEAKIQAQQICEAAPLAVRYAKELLVRTQDLTLEEALRLEDDIQSYILRTEDCKEGFSAFLEKRKPRWKGK